jgi:adenosylmethionine-8-amino-7-oxononanoate aminotransferase
VVDVRVLGAIGVVELAGIENPAALRMALVREGVWIRPFRNIVYLTPALTIGEEELGVLCGAIVRVLGRGTV